MLQFKLVLLGDSSVGKSSIVHRFVKDTFDELRESTIGAAFMSQSIIVKDSETHDDITIKFEIWDTAGQERYKSLAPMYYRNANAAIVVYDITQSDSLDKAKLWVDELKNKVGDDQLVIYLVGNKLDLCNGETKDSEGEIIERKVERLLAEQYADDKNLYFNEVSAKTGENIKEIFQTTGERLYLQRKANDTVNDTNGNNKNRNDHVKINLPRPSTNDSTGCC